MTSSYEWGWTAAGVGWVNFDPHLWVYDKANGKMLAEIALPSNAISAPVTHGG
jgi:hypothetical protein